ncbi:MAG: hypothetical protein J2P52_03350, partial [Blastocatellia bacterium]|nr:hypothetical protein [Blastocatellia bacterium]
MNYGRFKKILVSIALMCVFALPMAVMAASSVYAQSGAYSDVAQRGRYGYRGYGYRGYGYRGYGYPHGGYGGYYRGGYYNPYYRPYYRGYYGNPYGGYYNRGYYGRPGYRFGFRF